MIYNCDLDDLDLPKCNILSFLFPEGRNVSTIPLWMEAECPSRGLSPAQLLSWVKRFSVGLDRLGIKEQRAVMIFSPNHLFVPVVYLGAAGSKRYYTGANPAYTAPELAQQIQVVNAAVLLIHPSLLSIGLAAAKMAHMAPDRVFQFSGRPCAEVDGVRDWSAMLASEAESSSWMWDQLYEDATHQIASINFSSGTTGLPKGVCTSHYNLVANALQTIVAKFRGPVPDAYGSVERWLAFLPLYHAFSQLFTIIIACRLGVPVYIMQNFSLQDFLAHIQTFKITSIQAVPPVMAMLAKRPETARYDLSSLKNVMVGAAPLSMQLQNELMEKYNFFISRGWGMTETTCVGTLLPDNFTNLDGSSGFLLPNTEAKIVDENGNELATGAGELLVRGPQMMLGYWNNDNATQEALTKDGWMKTGDIVTSKEGMWWVVDRKKELIKVNGLQVAPAELEALLLQHDSVQDAAVVGLEVNGNEYPRAYVTVRPTRRKVTEAEIESFIAGQVAKHKRISGGVKFVTAVPRLLSGKVSRTVVKAWAKADAISVSTSNSKL